MWKQWRHWLPEVLFIAVIFGVSFAGALHAFFNQ